MQIRVGINSQQEGNTHCKDKVQGPLIPFS